MTVHWSCHIEAGAARDGVFSRGLPNTLTVTEAAVGLSVWPPGPFEHMPSQLYPAPAAEARSTVATAVTV